MASLTPAAVRRQIKGASTDPVYLLQGEDDVEKAALAGEFEELVEEGLRAFNVERVHVGDLTTGERMASGMASLTAAVRTLPMMAPRRVVLVFQAEALLAPKRESQAAVRALADLETLVKNPERASTLVLVAASVDKRSRAYKLLARHATTVECGGVSGQAEAERWVKNRVGAAGASIDPAGARLIAERAGPDVKRLRNDVDRLLLYSLGQKSITIDDVRQITGPAALQDDWAMPNAVESGDAAAALRQLALMLDAGVQPPQVLGQLGWLVRTKFPTLAPAGLRGAVEALFRTDQRLKGSGGSPRVLLERLVVELCDGVSQRGRGGFRQSVRRG